MATNAQTRANQKNAQKSTGPRTEAGKTKSSQNALKHGLRAQTTVLPGENIDDFHLLIAGLEDQFQPETALEWTLLRQLADAEWRMRRIPIIEAGAMAKHRHELREHYDCFPEQLPDSPGEVEIFLIGAVASRDAARGDVMAKLSRYESRLSHRYFKALEHLTRLKQQRQKSQETKHQATENPKPPQNEQTNPIPSGTGNPACDRSGASSSACSVEPPLDAKPDPIQKPVQSRGDSHPRQDLPQTA